MADVPGLATPARADRYRPRSAGPVPVSFVNIYTGIPSLNAVDDRQYPVFLTWMPDDHATGVGTGNPNPVAEVADNDQTVGRVTGSISHSQFP